MPTANASAATSPSDDSAPPPKNPLRELIDGFASLRKLERSFWLCLAVYLLDGAAYFGILNILTLFLGPEGPAKMTDGHAGMSVSYMTGMLTLFMALLGWLSDRIGVRRAITITAIAGLVGRCLLTVAPGLPLQTPIIFGALTFMAFSAGILQTAVYAGVKQSTTAENSAIGFSLVYALMNGGIVAESFVSSIVRKHWGIAGVFWMCAGITAVYLVAHLALFPKNKGNPVPIPERKAGEAKRSWREHALLNPRFLFFIFILLGVRTLFAHQWLTMPDYVIRSYPKEVGARFEWINGLNPLIILIGTPLMAGLTRRVHVVTMMILGTGVSAAATFLLVPGPHLGPLIAYEIIFSCGEALWSSRFLEYVAEVAPPEHVGTYMGVAQIPWFLAKTTTGFYSGYMLTRFCPEHGVGNTGTMWLIYAFIACSSPVGLLLAQKWLKAGRLDDHVRKSAPA